jgi:putative ABC transport system ATP-binding protein
MNAVPDEDDVIVVDELERTYRLGEVEVRAIKGISLRIKRADFLVVTGRNGSGKSTLLHQLGLLDRPTGGRLLLNGRDVTAMHE